MPVGRKPTHVLRVPLPLWHQIEDEARESPHKKPSAVALDLLYSGLNYGKTTLNLEKTKSIKKTKTNTKKVILLKILIFMTTEDGFEFEWIGEDSGIFVQTLQQITMATVRLDMLEVDFVETHFPNIIWPIDYALTEEELDIAKNSAEVIWREVEKWEASRHENTVRFKMTPSYLIGEIPAFDNIIKEKRK